MQEQDLRQGHQHHHLEHRRHLLYLLDNERYPPQEANRGRGHPPLVVDQVPALAVLLEARVQDLDQSRAQVQDLVQVIQNRDQTGLGENDQESVPQCRGQMHLARLDWAYLHRLEEVR